MEALDLELSPTPAAVAQARSAVTRRFGALPPETLEDLRLLVTELVANGVLHGGLGPDDTLRVRVHTDGEKIRAEVVDPGAEGEICPRHFDPETPGGFGLHLVQTLSDRWGVRRDGVTCVWFEMHARHARSVLTAA